MSAAWHASTVHALITAGRDYLVERREDVIDLVDTVRDIIETGARVHLVSLHVARLVTRVEAAEARLRDVVILTNRTTCLVELMGRRIDQNDGGCRQMEDNIVLLTKRVAALESAVDSEAR